MMDSLDRAMVAASNKTSRLQSPCRVVEKGFVLLAASSKEEADEAAVVKDRFERPGRPYPAAAAATGQLGALHLAPFISTSTSTLTTSPRGRGGECHAREHLPYLLVVALH